jgi:hypothetical protein
VALGDLLAVELCERLGEPVGVLLAVEVGVGEAVPAPPPARAAAARGCEGEARGVGVRVRLPAGLPLGARPLALLCRAWLCHGLA